MKLERWLRGLILQLLSFVPLDKFYNALYPHMYNSGNSNILFWGLKDKIYFRYSAHDSAGYSPFGPPD